MRSAMLVAVAASLGLAACHPDLVLDPSRTDIGGQWQMSWSGMTGSLNGVNYSCTASLQVVLGQTGLAFQGAQSGPGTRVCTAGTAVTTDTLVSEVIAGGVVQGDSVAFQLGSALGREAGAGSANQLAGVATWELPRSGGNTVTLYGTWTAVRQ